MPGLGDLIKQAPTHKRRMEVTSYPLDDGRLIAEGWLLDERFNSGFHWSGNERPPGVIHHLRLRLLIGGWPLTIQEAEAEMLGVPTEYCREIKDSVKKVEGVPIVHGYSDEVRRRLDGIEGCNHLTHLLVVMGPAALHGYWTMRSRQKQPRPKKLEDVPGLSYLVDSCWVWRKNGPLVERMRQALSQEEG
ncbi:MAG: DUF2889 domain-containing protein [Pseudomonadota bacterium]